MASVVRLCVRGMPLTLPMCCAERLDRYQLRRQVKQPREGFTLQSVQMQTVAPIPYDVLKEGVVQ